MAFQSAKGYLLIRNAFVLKFVELKLFLFIRKPLKPVCYVFFTEKICQYCAKDLILHDKLKKEDIL